MSIRKELPKTYDPKASEGKLYQFWTAEPEQWQ